MWWQLWKKQADAPGRQEHEETPWDKYNAEREIKVLYGAPDRKMAAALLALVVKRTGGGEIKARLDQNGEESTYLLDRSAIARMLADSGLRITFCRNNENVFCPEDKCMLQEAREIHVEDIFHALNWYIVLAPAE